VRRVRLAMALTVLLGLATASPARAVGPTFAVPGAESAFLSGITFSQPVSGLEIGSTAEILIERGSSKAPYVVQVPLEATAGRATLTYVLDLALTGEHPNTRYRASWRLTSPTGIVTLGPEVAVVYADDRFDWRTLTGDIVRLHWMEGDATTGRRLLAIAEAAVAEASELFGVAQVEPIDFFVYADPEAFAEALGPGSRENVGGIASPDTRTLLARVAPEAVDDSFAGSVIRHELTHLVFHSFVENPYHFPPKWLDEGVATYLADGLTAARRGAVEAAVRDGELMPLDALVRQFPTTRERFSLAYSESASAIDFLVRSHGRDAMVALAGEYAGGASDDEAFRAAIGLSLDAFAATWLADLGAPAPEAFGPRPAPAGPLPSDWQGPPATPDPIAEASPSPGATPAPSPTSGRGDGDDPSGAAGTPVVITALAVALLAGGMMWRRRRGRDRGAVP